MAERQGFEPWDGFPSPVFKTGAFDHSATSPIETDECDACWKPGILPVAAPDFQ